MLLEAWKEFEEETGDGDSLERVKKLMPQKVVKRVSITSTDASQKRWEEYIDYVFPEDKSGNPALQLLARAKEWAKKQGKKEAPEESTESQMN